MQDRAKQVMLGLLTLIVVCVLVLTVGVVGGKFDLYLQLQRGVFFFAIVTLVLVVGSIGIHQGLMLEKVKRLEGVLDHAKDGLLGLDGEGSVQWVNSQGARILGWDSRELCEAELRGKPFMGGVLLTMGRDPFRDSEADGLVVLEGDFGVKGGGRVDVSYSCKLMDRRGYVVSFEDITKQKKAQLAAWTLAQTDELTGLANRRRVADKIEELIARPSVEGEPAPFTVFFIDLDKFKAVNDSYGHSAGDFLLMEVAYRLQGLVRASDLVARLGGDEFLVLISNPLTEARTRGIAQKLVDVLSRPLDYGDQPIEVSASVGVTSYPRDGTSFEELAGNADFAMYEAKQRGRNGFCFFNEEHKQRLSRSKLLGDQLGCLLRESTQLATVELPSLRTKLTQSPTHPTIWVAELEWPHPEWGVVTQGELLALLPSALTTRWLEQYLAHVLPEVARLVEDGRAQKVILEGIQVSAAQPLLAWLLDGSLSQHGLTGSRVVLRVESRLMRDARGASDLTVCAGLKALGCELLLADLGGSTSLDDLIRGGFDRAIVSIDWLEHALSTNAALVNSLEGECRAQGCQWMIWSADRDSASELVQLWVATRGIWVI